MVEDLCSKSQKHKRVMKFMKDLSFIWWVRILRCLKNWMVFDLFHQRILHLWVSEQKYGLTLTMTIQKLYQNTRIFLRQCLLKLDMSILQRLWNLLTWKEMKRSKPNLKRRRLKRVNERVTLIFDSILFIVFTKDLNKNKYSGWFNLYPQPYKYNRFNVNKIKVLQSQTWRGKTIRQTRHWHHHEVITNLWQICCQRSYSFLCWK